MASIFFQRVCIEVQHPVDVSRFLTRLYPIRNFRLETTYDIIMS
jgi:hypothetical protein